MDFLKKGQSLLRKLKPLLMDEETTPEATDGASEPEVMDATSEESTEALTTQGANSPSQKTTWFVALSSFFNGAGIGLLMGILLGMAITPVVGKFIGTLTGLLAVLLGLSDKFISTAKALRLGAFGFFCVGGIFFGMFIRANNGMLPSNEKMMQEYLEIGFSEEEARDFIAYQKLNLVPTDWKGVKNNAEVIDTIVETEEGEPEGVSAEAGDEAEEASVEQTKAVVKSNTQKEAKPKTSRTTTSESKKREFANTNQTGAQFSSHLYSSEVSLTKCTGLSYLNDMTSIEQIQKMFHEADGEEPGVWTAMANGVDKSLPEHVQKQVLLNTITCFCENSEVDFVVLEDCTFSPETLNEKSLDEIKTALINQGEVWSSLVRYILEDIDEKHHKAVLLNLSKNLCND